jgi:release factor glutamine methyltransferase
MRRVAYRLWLRLRFLLWQRHRHDRLRLENCAGIPIVVLPGVFNPALFRTSDLVADVLQRNPVPDGSQVLDLGSGSGILAVVAARRAHRVVAVDSNPQAVRCTRINALLNGVERRVEVREGDLFEPVADERFDLVLCNPPFYRGLPRNQLESAFRSDDFAERFATGIERHLSADGCALVVLSSDGDEAGFLSAFEAAGLPAEPVLERDLISETVRVYRIAGRQR